MSAVKSYITKGPLSDSRVARDELVLDGVYCGPGLMIGAEGPQEILCLVKSMI